VILRVKPFFFAVVTVGDKKNNGNGILPVAVILLEATRPLILGDEVSVVEAFLDFPNFLQGGQRVKRVRQFEVQ
jgi:hypothetical protein